MSMGSVGDYTGPPRVRADVASSYSVWEQVAPVQVDLAPQWCSTVIIAC